MKLFDGTREVASISVTKNVQGLNGKMDWQTVEFDRSNVDEDGKEHFFIFDDHPEHIKQCDILDGDRYGFEDATALMHAENLKPGVYTVFSYHHKTIGYSDNLDKGLTIGGNIPLYYNTIFSTKNGGTFRITKLGFDTDVDQSMQDKIDVWKDFSEHNNKRNNMYYRLNQNISLKAYNEENKYHYELLTDFTSVNNTISKTNSMGHAFLMMEFEVVEGSVDFYTVAYLNKDKAMNSFMKSYKEDALKSTYEYLETLKGVADTTQKIQARPMEYVIDESVENGSRLVYNITNQFYQNRKCDIFTTHVTPLSEWNRWTVPDSVVTPIRFKGYGIDRESNQYMISSPDKENGWIFDSYHTRTVKKVTLPSEVMISPMDKRQREFGVNEKLSKLLMEQIAESGRTTPGEIPDDLKYIEYMNGLNGDMVINGFGYQMIMPNYGMTQVYNFKIHNSVQPSTTDSGDRIISYLMQGDDEFFLDYKFKIDGKIVKTIKNNKKQIDGLEEVLSLEIPQGKTAEMEIEVTSVTGSHSTVHNAFIIHSGKYNMPESLMDGHHIMQYPQE